MMCGLGRDGSRGQAEDGFHLLELLARDLTERISAIEDLEQGFAGCGMGVAVLGISGGMIHSVHHHAAHFGPPRSTTVWPSAGLFWIWPANSQALVPPTSAPW